MWPRGASEAQTCQNLVLILKPEQGLWVSVDIRSSVIPDSSSQGCAGQHKGILALISERRDEKNKEKGRMDFKKKTQKGQN